MTTLISFLGKGRRDVSTNAYQKVVYRIDGVEWPATSYFGQALAKHLGKTTKLVVLGTASSIWDVFGLDLTEDNNELFDKFSMLELDKAISEGCVTQAMLDELGVLLSQQLGMQVILVLIGFAQSTQEQAHLLEKVSQHVAEGDHVALDVTHGFRHLPMLALVAARYLEHVRQAKVDDIFYGALEMCGADGVAPVIKLKGLLTMLDWVDALSSYKKDGDYSTFADLRLAGGMSEGQANDLRRAAFHERANSSELAKPKLSTASAAIADQPNALVRLFKGELQKRMAWAKEPDRSARELALADAYLQRKDFLRGVLYLFEGLITAEVMRAKGNHGDYVEREEAKQRLKESRTEFGELDRLRNALAHGLRSDDKAVNRWLENEEAMEAQIRRIRKALR